MLTAYVLHLNQFASCMFRIQPALPAHGSATLSASEVMRAHERISAGHHNRQFEFQRGYNGIGNESRCLIGSWLALFLQCNCPIPQLRLARYHFTSLHTACRIDAESWCRLASRAVVAGTAPCWPSSWDLQSHLVVLIPELPCFALT